MKKYLKTLGLALATLLTASFALTSCEDDSIAYSLEGTWEGNMYQEFEYGGEIYRPSSTEIYFERDPYRYSSGRGYWIDNFNYRGWSWKNNYIANHIEWEVENGDIYIYLQEDNVEFRIHNYRLSNNYFTGELWGNDGSYGEFSLRHVDSPNWYSYDYYGYDYFDYYYAKSRGGSDKSVMGNRPVRLTK